MPRLLRLVFFVCLIWIGCEPQFEHESYTPANFRYVISTRQKVGDNFWELQFRSQLIDGPVASWIDDQPLSLEETGSRTWEADTLIVPSDQIEYRYSWKYATLDATVALPHNPFPEQVRVNEIPIEIGSPTLFNEADSYRVTWQLDYPLMLMEQETDGSQEQRTLDLYWNASGDTMSVQTTDSTLVFHANEGDTVSFSFYLFAFNRRLYNGSNNSHRDPTIYGWFFFEAWSDTFQFLIRPNPDSTLSL